jgi:4-amino-4-deoxy-L-arabinose transferase-like glycosyltransferase
MPHTKSGRLALWQIWLIMCSGGILWLSGAAWVLLHYFGEIQGEFGPETNPAQPWLLKLHGLVLIPAILVFGSLLVAHIPKGWNDKGQRIGGIVVTGILVTLIISGYMLYYAGSDALREWSSTLHWIIGILLPVGFLWHYSHRYSNRKSIRKKNIDHQNIR